MLTPEGSIKEAKALSGRSAVLKEVLAREQQFGNAVEVLGDWDGDDIPEIAISEIGHPDRGTGRVFICWMQADFTVKKLQLLDPAEHEALASLRPGQIFGHSLAYLGDLAGDGNHTLAVGAPLHDGGGHQKGSFWLIKMDKEGIPQSIQPVMGDQNGFTGFIETDDRFGMGLAPIGDMNGDSIPDLVVSAIRND
ncbi:MAG: integrin alpha, partial [Bacteroidota bacterium]